MARDRVVQDELRRIRRRDTRPDDLLRASFRAQPREKKQIARAVGADFRANEGHAVDAGETQSLEIFPIETEVHPRGAVNGEPVRQKARQRAGDAFWRRHAGVGKIRLVQTYIALERHTS